MRWERYRKTILKGPVGAQPAHLAGDQIGDTGIVTQVKTPMNIAFIFVSFVNRECLQLSIFCLVYIHTDTCICM